jgi:predicted DNA-binding transcriptional regulator AlpA
MKNGEFPAQVSLRPRAVGWLEVEVDRWIASRVDLSRPSR